MRSRKSQRIYVLANNNKAVILIYYLLNNGKMKMGK